MNEKIPRELALANTQTYTDTHTQALLASLNPLLAYEHAPLSIIPTRC